MSARMLRAAVLNGLGIAALAIALAPGARAADLGGDDRYAPYAEEREYREGGAYGEPYPPPRRPYAEDERSRYDDYGADRPERYADGCVPRWRVRRNLENDGWVDVQPLDRSGGLVTLRARREESGRIFLLRVDRCTGEVVRARRDYLRSFGDGLRQEWGAPGWRQHARTHAY